MRVFFIVTCWMLGISLLVWVDWRIAVGVLFCLFADRLEIGDTVTEKIKIYHAWVNGKDISAFYEWRE